MNGLDVFLLALLAVLVLIAVFKGVLRMVFEVAGFVLSLYFSSRLSMHFAPLLYDRWLHERVMNSVSEKLQQTGLDSLGAGVQQFVDSLPFSLDLIEQKTGIQFQQFLSQIQGKTSVSTVAANLEATIVKPAATLLCTGILLLAFMVLFSIAILILSLFLKKIHLPAGFEFANRLLGGLFGLVKGGLVVFTLCAILGLASSAFGTILPEKFSGTVEGSAVTQWVNRHNPVLDHILKE